MDEPYNLDGDSEADGPEISVRSGPEQAASQASGPRAALDCNGLNGPEEEPSEATPEISRLQMEGFARPQLFHELIETVNCPEMTGIERSLRLVHELPQEVLSCLFEEHLDKMVLVEDLTRFLSGVCKLRNGLFPAPDELANIAYASYALDQLTKGLRAVNATRQPRSKGIPERLIIDLELGSKRLCWPGPYGVAQWLSGLADGYTPDSLSPVPGPA